MSTTPTTQSLADRLAAAKTTVTENPWKTVGTVLVIIAFLVALGFGVRYLMQRGSAGQVDAAGANAAGANAAAAGAAGSANGAAGAAGLGTAPAAGAVAAPAAGAAAAPVAGAALLKNNAAPVPVASVAGIQATTPAMAATAQAAKEMTVAQLADNHVPWWQREYAKMPAMEVCGHGKYNAAPFPYDDRNNLYDAQAYNELNNSDPSKDDLYAVAASAKGDTVSEIYARARSNGIALLNRGAIRDPEKMLPRADPNSEYMRLFQVGASISDIQKNLPKTTDLMRMARERPSGMAFSIPLEKPPLYTEGVNCERRARIPSRASDKNQLFCINPIDPREFYDYRPHPLLDSVLADGGRNPNGGGFAQDAPSTSSTPSGSAAGSSASAAAMAGGM